MFTQELSRLLSARLSLERALTILESDDPNDVTGEILGLVRGGAPFAQALEGHPDLFDTLYISMVRAGEAAGALPEVFSELTKFYEQEKWTSESVRNAMLYPMLLLIASFGAMLFIFSYVVPQFEGLLAGNRVETGDWLGVLFGLSHFVQQFWIHMLGFLLIALLALDRYSKSPAGRMAKDRLLLKLPFLGLHFRKREAARFARVLAILTGHHVPLLRAIEIVLGTVRNQVLQGQLAGLPDDMKKGDGMATPLAATGAFPPFVSRMVTIGEETGGLAEMFGDLARFYDREVEGELKAFLAVLEPAIILFVGAIVGTVVISILSALMSVTDYIG